MNDTMEKVTEPMGKSMSKSPTIKSRVNDLRKLIEPLLIAKTNLESIIRFVNNKSAVTPKDSTGIEMAKAEGIAVHCLQSDIDDVLSQYSDIIWNVVDRTNTISKLLRGPGND